MTERIRWWLTIDPSMIVISAIIIGIVWMGFV
jgi:hypothetical protein